MNWKLSAVPVTLMLCVSMGFGQGKGGGGGRSTTPVPPATHGDFSRASDPTLRNNIEFQKYPKDPLKLSTTTTYVTVPTIVTDKNGKFIPGLKKEDFVILENNKPQKVQSVDEFKAMGIPPQTVEKKAANEYTNAMETADIPRRFVIIALDMVNTPIIDQSRARMSLLKFLSEGVEPGVLYQIVAIGNNGLTVLHDYTTDTKDLIAALKKVNGSYSTTNAVVDSDLRDGMHPATGQGLTAQTVDPNGQVNKDVVMLQFFASGESAYSQYQQAAAAQSTLMAFQQIAERASGIPGRKSLIWVTASFPFSLDSGTGAVDGSVGFEGYQHTMQLLSDAMIAVYPVNAKGLLTLQVDASMKLSRKEMTEYGNVISALSDQQNDINATMLTFAEMTGGRAYLNTNDLKGSIKDAGDDGASYYLLTYKMDPNDKRQGWRKLTVKAGDYKIRARKGYFATQSALDPTQTTRYDIDHALLSPLDYTGLPLKVVLDPIADSGAKKKMTFALMMAPRAIKINTDENNRINVDIAYVVTTDTGKDAGHKGVNYAMSLNDVQSQQLNVQGLSYGDSVELAPGKYKLRVVVRDNSTGQIGSVAAPIEVK